jgi:shikimate dehydrogenase
MNKVHTLKDLSSRELLDAGEAKPARLAVIGYPISHSASPRMHQPALDAEGKDLRYVRIEVEPGQVAEAFARMRALGFIGCNVTVPHKLEAMAACDEVHPDAMALGAVNTIRFDGEGIRGFNTDGPGFVRAVEEDFGVPFHSLRIAIAGAGGGAGQAIATQAVLLGVPKLVVINRSVEKLAPLVTRLREMNLATEVVALALGDPEVPSACFGCDLIVNTSSLGLKPGDASILPTGCLRKEHLVYDTIYQPPVTPLLGDASELGCRTSNGLSMLINQGALAFHIWFPETHPLPVMRAALAARSG